MIEVSVNVPEVREFINDIIEAPKKVFDLIRFNVQETVGKYLSYLMNAELTMFLGRGRYERRSRNGNYRNGSYERRFTLKGIGEVTVRVPRDRKGLFRSEILPARKQYEDALREDLSLMFLSGVSTRTLSLISNRLIGRGISHEEVSKANRELTEAVERWRMRDLSEQVIEYLYVDGVIFHMRIGGSVEKVSVLVAIGVTQGKHRKVLGLQSGDKESAGNWREFFKDLKARGLQSEPVILGIMDGLAGLEKVFKEEFPNAQVQRCQLHVAKNVLAKVPRKFKEGVADDMRSIFYASSKDKARQFFQQFSSKWSKEIPSAVGCLENSLDACLTFFSYPKEQWISLRTTNVIERLNKEFKRRTKPMEIVAGENSCYRLLAFISLKMELYWRANPVGRVRENLPFFNQIAKKEFTQLS
jgi:putative transposase